MIKRNIGKLAICTIIASSFILNTSVIENSIVEASESVVNNSNMNRIDVINLLKYVNFDTNTFEGDLKFKDMDIKNSDILELLVSKGSISNVEFFNPHQELTRSQLSKIIVNSFGLTKDGPSNIKDVKQFDYRYNDLDIMVSNNFFKLENGNVVPGKKVSNIEFINILENVITKEMFIDETGFLNINYYNYLLEIEKLKSIPKIKISYEINNSQDMHKLLKKIESELPERAVLTSEYFNIEQLKDMYYQANDLYSVEHMENKATLSNYNIKKVGRTLVILDNTSKEYDAKTIHTAYNVFVKELSEGLKTDNEKETLLNIYNYIYDRYTYTASNWQEMLVGNLGTGEMACNGFSRLANDLLKEVGIDSVIRGGTSHYWNIIKIDGVATTFDVTTDILKKERYLTLGNNTDDHIENTSSIGFFTAEYQDSKYTKVHTKKIID